MATIKRHVKYERGPIGLIIKWLYIIFNLLMALWLFSYWGDISPMIEDGSGAEQAGAAIGSAIGTGLILTAWVLGAVILGIPVLLTKGKRIEIEEAADTSEKTAQKEKNVGPNSKKYRKLGFVLSSIFLVIAVATSGTSLIASAFLLISAALLFPPFEEFYKIKALRAPTYRGLIVFLLVVLAYILVSSGNAERQAIEEEALNRAVIEDQKRAKQEKLRAQAEFEKDPEAFLAKIDDLKSAGKYQDAIKMLENLDGLNDGRIIALSEEVEKKRESSLKAEQEEAERLRHIRSWRVNVEQSPMDDSTNVFVSKQAEDNVNIWLGEARPVIFIRCKENKTDFILNAQTNFTHILGEYGKASITYRFDDNKAVTELWSESTDGEAVFARKPIGFLKKLAASERLRFQYTPFNAGQVVAEFDVRGVRPHIEKVATRCNWSL